ncbi:hypothetical protein ASPZODRAFT_103088 [Penicilliopsis zonata CBS 506.65]|uniref:Probable glucan endo-1,3-beta-glucosidase eglC n=1 Tax=Penicilliopsis zonata CBS 506.65 TaxID=1073090 RepID=A0A1L9S933_9EURO|nr:hypothetical protein ASPZODRAFT_103088 [Penicilliopsis zonata CBS 506.65]OJJ43671.1 hypothetical protein ASPZODRAFT_103088 [Penicilliopsis zonata CBS 506.65]
MQLQHLLAFALSLATSEAVYQGFNYGSTYTDGTNKVQSDFEAEFKTAKNLAGTDGGFTSARLYTMIQGGTTDTPISAIPAAIAEKTTLLLGIWASGGDFDNELAALKSAISEYGDDLTDLVAGISVGSEDLYRDSTTGIEADAGVGVGPDTIVSYIKQVREAISGTTLSAVPVGHVDTWTAWVNGSNSEVIDNCDWLGVDAYPFFQNTESNAISDAKALFLEAMEKTNAVADGKEVWVTETGWPVSGDTENLAVASTANAKTYWDEVGCPLFGVTNTWWYILQDASPTTPNPSFGVVGSTLSDTPLYNLTCSASNSTSSSSANSTTASSSRWITASATASSKIAGATGANYTYTSGSASATKGSGSSSAGAASASSTSVVTSTSGANTLSGSIFGAVIAVFAFVVAL